ncbi:MAG: SMC-Scp complex subunit ScpB [Bacillales bacterium]|nr:SMC-Scp complex subunit ScpB [Bacillales bacterium]
MLEGVLEGILFVCGDDGISKDRLLEILEINSEELDNLLVSYSNSLKDSKRGINLELLGGKYKLVTKKEHNEYYKKMVDIEKNDSLSQSSLEVLAIIAYNMPITRSKIEEIRGVDSTYAIRKLTFLNLIEEVGRSELPGRPILYGITNGFLDYLGLKSIDELPKLEIISNESNDEVELYDSKYKEN